MQIVLVSSLLSLAAGATALAQSPGTLTLGGNMTTPRVRQTAGVNAWTSLGPDGGGAEILVVDPQDPETVYAATSAVILKSTDGAGSWKALSPLPVGSGVLSLVVDPQNSGTLYVAGLPGESGGPADAVFDTAVFKSTDGGTTWLPLHSGSALRLCTPVAVDPRNSNVIYSGGYTATSNAILKSTDGGATWSVTPAGERFSDLFPGSAVDCCFVPTLLAIDPGNSANVYAGFFSGLFKSTNGGASWRSSYAYSAVEGRFRNLAIDARNSKTLYVLGGTGVFKSTDGGIHWRAMNSGLPTSGEGVNSFAMDPQDSSTLYAGTFSGLYKSTDGGASWQASNLGLGTGQKVGALAVDPVHSGTLYANSPSCPECPGPDRPQAGVYKSTDGGANWVLRIRGLQAISISGLAIDPQDPATIYATSLGFGRFKSTDAGTSWQELPASGSGPLVLDSTSTLYAAAAAPGWEWVANAPPGGAGVKVIRSQDGGATWNPVSGGLPQICASVLSFAIDPLYTHTVYASFNSFDSSCESRNTGGLWRTSDGGASWTKLAPTPAGGGGEMQGGGGGMHGIAIDPQNSSTLYGWNGWGFFKSTDRGATWDTLNLGLPAREINVVTIDPQTPATVYAVLNGDGIFKSVDGGASWNAVNSGLPAKSVGGSQKYLVNSLVIDPFHPDTLYAGGGGAFRSTDGGTTWSSVGDGLTTFVVNALAIDPRDTRTVYAGTDGGVFVITFSPWRPPARRRDSADEL